MYGTARVLRPIAAEREYDASIFVALELSRSNWLLAVSVPHSDRISKYRVCAGDSTAPLNLFLSRLRAEAERRHREPVKLISIYEAGLEGF